MSQYTPDGGVISSGVPRSSRSNAGRDHYSTFGLYNAMVLETIYPKDPRNSTGERVEYKVKIHGQIYLNATDMRRSGGVFDFSERSRKKVERARNSKLDEGTFDENLDGEHVYVLFVEGHGDLPVIIGAPEHPQRGSTAKASDGPFDKDVFNGVEISIDKDSTWKIEQIGRKDPKGSVENSAAVGSQIKVDGADGKIAIGKGSAELLDIVDQIIDEIDGTQTDIQAITVPTAMGPSGPPINSVSFSLIASNLASIKALLAEIKGSL